MKQSLNTSLKSDIYYTNYNNLSLLLPKIDDITHTSTNTFSNLLKQIKPSSNNITQISSEVAMLIKKLSKEASAEIVDKFSNVFISQCYVTNIDILRYKCENNYYCSQKSLISDISYMFSYISNSLLHFLIPKQNVQFLQIYEKYVSSIYEAMIKMVINTNIEEMYSNDIAEMLQLNNLPRVQMRNDSLPEKKGYEIISDFCHVKPEETIPKTLTSILPSCDGECCKEYSQLGPLNLESSHWNSNCVDRKGNIECNPTICKCKEETCKNMSLYCKRYKKINEDVEERYTWGIDLYTYRNLLNLFPENFTDDDDHAKDFKHFIEKSLMIALSKLGKYGNTIEKGCEFILQNADKYSYLDITLAEHLINIYSSIDICKKEINNAFSKGIGIFCIKQTGIKQNELIAPYLGEIYSPYMWYEKQDIIKRKKLDKNLPDFYNIMLERMKCDKDGYDILMVDPNSKGNFASRMSHSCNPNCNTVLMISGGQYTIGMFAMKDISNDEELTFDYNSVTEKEKEFYDAICLCSTFNCRGHYLILSNSIIFTEIINKFHSFLHRNALLVKACVKGNKDLNEKEKSILDKYSVKTSMLNNAPIWLKRWSALILTFVDVEKELLPIILYKAEMQERDEVEKKEKKVEVKKEKEKEKKVESNKKKDKSSSKDNSNHHNSSAKKKKPTKPTIFNYNFKDDYIWEKKSYASSSRQKILEEKKKQEMIMRMQEIEEMKKKEEEEKAKKAEEAQKQEEIKDKMDIDEEEENNNIDPSLNLIDSNDPINEDDIELENIDNDFLDLQLGSNSFAFLSELNLQLEEDYDKELYENIKMQVAGITEQRIQNLAVTLDKIKHLLSLIHCSEPPLKVLNEEETYNYYWKNLRSALLEKFNKISQNEIVTSNQELNEIIKEIIQKLSYNPITFVSNNIPYKKLNYRIRKILLDISLLIKKCATIDTSKKLVFYEGLGDILYLYSKTKIHFTPNQNVTGQYLSEKIQIRKRDVDISCLSPQFIDAPLDTVIAEEQKEYENHYLWGQLVGWYKQTVDKPNASLSAERRGTLSYPELESFFVKDNNDKIFNYPCGGKENFYMKLIDNTSLMWPVGNDWSFKNKYKVYGTVQFDAVYFENLYLNKIKQYVSDIVSNIL